MLHDLGKELVVASWPLSPLHHWIIHDTVLHNCVVSLVVVSWPLSHLHRSNIQTTVLHNRGQQSSNHMTTPLKHQHQWHQHRDLSKWTEDWDSHKLQVPGLSYNWWGFQVWDTLQDGTDNSSTGKVETGFEWQENFSHNRFVYSKWQEAFQQLKAVRSWERCCQ